MSLKENIGMVKEELNSEEKLFESAVKAERFVKKYRNLIIGGVAGVVLLVAANALYEANQEVQFEAANAAYATLLKDSSDASAKADLERLNPKLYDMWALSQAVENNDTATLETLSSSKSVAVADIASYELAAMTRDMSKLDAYGLRQGAVYKDLAIVENALLLMKEGKLEAAHGKLEMVGEESPLYQVAQLMLHYGVK